MLIQTSSRIYLLITLMILMIVSCKKEPSYSGELQIITDKQVYRTTDPIIVEVSNHTDSIAVYMTSIKQNIIPIVYRYDIDRFTGYLADYNFQNLRGNKELYPGFTVKDTLHMDFKKGIYRIEYNIIMRPEGNSKARYSNIFIVE